MLLYVKRRSVFAVVVVFTKRKDTSFYVREGEVLSSMLLLCFLELGRRSPMKQSLCGSCRSRCGMLSRFLCSWGGLVTRLLMWRSMTTTRSWRTVI